MKVSLEFPDDASLTQFAPNYLKAVLIATLYHLGQLSEHEACVALGVTRRAFEELLPRFVREAASRLRLYPTAV